MILLRFHTRQSWHKPLAANFSIFELVDLPGTFPLLAIDPVKEHCQIDLQSCSLFYCRSLYWLELAVLMKYFENPQSVDCISSFVFSCGFSQSQEHYVKQSINLASNNL